MNDDSAKINQLKEILQTADLGRTFELVSSALSINDEEDRNLYLLETIYWLLKNGIWQKAYGTAQLLSESYEKSEALCLIADHLVKIGHPEKAFWIYDESEKHASAGNFAAWQKAELLHNIAKSLTRANAVFKAEEMWEKAVNIAESGENSDTQNALDAASVLAEIAAYFASENRMEAALKIANKIKNVGRKESVLQQIAKYSQETKRVA